VPERVATSQKGLSSMELVSYMFDDSVECGSSCEMRVQRLDNEIQLLLWNLGSNSVFPEPCPEPDDSTPHTHIISVRSVLILSAHRSFGLPSGRPIFL
jgi:hypothetical protein